MSSDEGTFRPPGAPGGEVEPWDAGRGPVPRPAGTVEPRAEATPPGAGDAPGRHPGPWWQRLDEVGESGWRWIAVAAGVLVFATTGLSWYHYGGDTCRRFYPSDADMRRVCGDVVQDGWSADRWGIVLALAAAALSLLRLARRGPAWLDAVVAGFAGLAGLLTVRALFSPPEQFMRLTWPGPLVLLPLVGVLGLAGVQTYRSSRRSGALSWKDVGERAREQLGNQPLRRLPTWLRPAGIWRRRRRWAAGAVVVFGALLLHDFAKGGTQGTTTGANVLPPPPGATATGPAGTGAPPAQQQQRPSAAPSQTRDGAGLLTAARRAVAAARAVQVHAEPATDVTVDLQLTSALSAQGTISAPLANYDVRRVGNTCWVRGLPGHGVAAWVPTCTIPAHRGAPVLDVATLTDWRVMVARMPYPAGATAATQPESLGVAAGSGIRVTAADGSLVYLPAGEGADPHPLRVTTARPGFGTVTVDYTQWTTEPVTIGPP